MPGQIVCVAAEIDARGRRREKLQASYFIFCSFFFFFFVARRFTLFCSSGLRPTSGVALTSGSPSTLRGGPKCPKFRIIIGFMV